MLKKILILVFAVSLFQADENYPDWIIKSIDENYVYGVGSAPKNPNFSLQLKIAKMQARASLSENISVEILSQFNKKTSSEGTEIIYTMEQKSKNLLKYSKLLKTWKSKDGELFVLMAVKKSDIQK
jgi:hypothetical protein